MSSIRVHLLTAFSLFSALSCGATGESMNDGKFRPESSGVEVNEGPACDQLRSALQTHGLELGCTSTGRACPDFLRVPTASKCAKFDKGTIDGCADHYREATSCDDLTERIDRCVVVVIDGSEPSGC
jgi:hypothetical protein